MRPSRNAGSPNLGAICASRNDGVGARYCGVKLIEQIGREVGEFVFDLELHARGQKRRAFKQAADHRVERGRR